MTPEPGLILLTIMGGVVGATVGALAVIDGVVRRAEYHADATPGKGIYVLILLVSFLTGLMAAGLVFIIAKQTTW